MIVNGKQLAVEVDGQGPAVLLVHGLGGTSNFYQVQTDALADRFREVIQDAHRSAAACAILRAGHGPESERTRAGSTLAR